MAVEFLKDFDRNSDRKSTLYEGIWLLMCMSIKRSLGDWGGWSLGILYTSDIRIFSFFQILGTTTYGFHTIMIEEQKSFARWLNRHLGDIAELSHLLPLAESGDDLYEKIGDGILFW